MSRRILLTGATGFVGRPLLRRLLEGGNSVRVVLRTGKALDLDCASGVDSFFETPDFFDASDEWYERVCEGVDLIIHSAWYAEPGKYLVSPKNLDCLAGSIRFAKAASRVGVKRFVGVGTCFEYDLSQGLLSTGTPLLPTTPYAAAKTATYLALSHCLPLLNVEFAWARLFYLYGVGEDSRRFAAYLHHCLSNGIPAELSSGSQIRDFLDVEEAARRLALFSLSRVTGPLNICSGEAITVREFAMRIAMSYGRPDLLRFGARAENLTDPAMVVGVPSLLPEGLSAD